MMRWFLLAAVGCGPAEQPEAPPDYFETCRGSGDSSPDCPSGLICAEVTSDSYTTVCTYACEEDIECPAPVHGFPSECIDKLCTITEE